MASNSAFSSLGSLDEFSSSDDEDNATNTKPNEEESLVVPELKKGDVDNNIITAKRRRTLIALNDGFLLSPSGLTSLKKDYFDKFTCNLQHNKPQDYSTNELGNLNRMFATYEKWSSHITMKQGGLPVFPKEAGNWDEFVDKLERIKKVQLRKKLHHMRVGVEDAVFAVPLMPTTTPPTTVLEATPSTNSSSLTAASALSEETRRLIEQKREEALKRRNQKQLASPPCSPSLLDGGRASVRESPAQPPRQADQQQQSQASTLKWDDEDFDVKYRQHQQQQEEEEEPKPMAEPRPVVDSQAPTQQLDSQAPTQQLDSPTFEEEL